MLPLEGERKRTLVSFIEGAFEVMMRMTGFIIALAPFGIAALIARLVSSTGLNVFLDMKWYVLTVFTALAVHLLVTLPLIVFLMTRRNPYRYLRVMSPALLTGFSTASSSGTLPITLERAEHGAGISNRIASFVLPLGATINMDGTALYEIVSVLFIAQIHAGIDPNFALTFGQQLVSIGAAGIPHAGLVMMVIILQAVGLPLEYTALIWAVDRILDMCRTAVNIASDSSIALVVADTENQVDNSVLWERSSA
jgi:Na+/H+-dicarboxylate symporter